TAGTPLTNAHLSANTAYYYEVSASNTGGVSVLSSPPVSATTLSPPAVPTGVTATATSSGSITVSWTASPSATWYQVFSSTSPSGPFVLVGGTLGTPLTNAGLSAGTTYYYEVVASNSVGTSALSPPVSATTLSPQAVPTGVTATAKSSSSITVSWTASPGATSYSIYRSTSSSGPFTIIGTTSAT